MYVKHDFNDTLFLPINTVDCIYKITHFENLLTPYDIELLTTAHITIFNMKHSHLRYILHRLHNMFLLGY